MTDQLRIVKINVSFSETKNLGNYSSVQIGVNVSGEVEFEGENQQLDKLQSIGSSLLNKARNIVQVAISEELEYNSSVSPQVLHEYKGKVVNNGNGNGNTDKIDF